MQVGKGGQQIITSPEEKRDLILLDITNSLFLDPADQRQLTTSNLRSEEQEDCKELLLFLSTGREIS